ncbi:MAG TPA: hypothetical protein VGE24_00585 [Emticicia sp.]
MKSTEFSEQFMYGLNLAIKRLIEKKALLNESLVISDKDGNIQKIPAKELLKKHQSNNTLNAD